MNPSPTRGRERNKPPNRKAWSMSGVHGERGQAERQEQSYLTEEARLAHAAALREWASIALARELPRLGNTPDNEKGLAWIHYRSIKDGEWFVAAKPELEAGMRPGIELKERIWHCGVLAATGFKGELAVKLSGGVLRPLSANDIRKRLNRADDEWAAEIGLDLADEHERSCTFRSKRFVYGSPNWKTRAERSGPFATEHPSEICRRNGGRVYMKATFCCSFSCAPCPPIRKW